MEREQFTDKEISVMDYGVQQHGNYHESIQPCG